MLATTAGSDTIIERKDKVLQAREKLKANSTKKRAELDESKLFQEFRAKVGETNIYYRKEEIDQRAFMAIHTKIFVELESNQLKTKECNARLGKIFDYTKKMDINLWINVKMTGNVRIQRK